MDLTHASHANEFVASILIEELHRHNLHHFFISPGSRSTPLTAVVASRPDSQIFMHFDERATAFAALGYARAAGKPGILVCTSGSAAANYLPAITEASTDNIPLIVLTADRPPELHNVRANQTMNQRQMYGSFTPKFLNIEPPSKDFSINSILQQFSSIVTESISYKQPVHINCMFREPLTPAKKQKDFSSQAVEISQWVAGNKPFAQKSKITRTNVSDLRDFSEALKDSINTLIVTGAGLSIPEQNKIVRFAESKNIPVFPDIRSGLRLHNNSDIVISYFDQLLLSESIHKSKLQVLHFGGSIVSKRFLQYIEKSEITEYTVIDTKTPAYNPHHKMTRHIQADIGKVIGILDKQISSCDKKFVHSLQKKNKNIEKIIEQNYTTVIEIAVMREISKQIKPHSALFIASSMPIRDFDMYASDKGPKLTVGSNRGLSGIDGTIASAVGFSLGKKKRSTVVLGDLALLHDLNSLACIIDHPYPITIVVINNNGGGIFSFLPISKQTEIFEKYYGTPHGVDFEDVSKMFQIPYKRITNYNEFCEWYKKSQRSNQAMLIEVASERKKNYNSHIALQKKIKNIFL